MSSELISIVMPVYNAAKFLDYSIPSVLSQTYQNIELVVVDDASSDNSYEIVLKYANLDNRVKAFSIPFVDGPKPTRDNAILRAKGDWIVYVDADDAIEYDMIEKLWKRHIETGADFVCPTMHLVERKGMPDLLTIPRDSFDLNNLYNGTEAMIRTLSSWEFGTAGALIHRKNITNLYQLENSLLYNDECDSRIYLNNSNLVAFSNASYYYTQHTNSSTHDKSVNARDLDGFYMQFVLYDFSVFCDYSIHFASPFSFLVNYTPKVLTYQQGGKICFLTFLIFNIANNRF